MEINERILKLFNKLFHTDFKDINISRDDIPEWDSMKHAELVITFQKEFKLIFKTKDIIDIKNLNEFVKAINNAQKN